MDDCVYVNGDALDYEVEWLGGGKDSSALAGRTVQLVARLRGTGLYALNLGRVRRR